MCFSYNSMKQIDFSSPVDHLWSTFDDVVAPFCLPESTPRALGAQTWPISPKLPKTSRNSAPLWTTFGVLLTTLWSLFSRRVLTPLWKGFWATGAPKGNEKGALGEGWMCVWITNSSVSWRSAVFAKSRLGDDSKRPFSRSWTDFDLHFASMLAPFGITVRTLFSDTFLTSRSVCKLLPGKSQSPCME